MASRLKSLHNKKENLEKKEEITNVNIISLLNEVFIYFSTKF